MAPTDQQLALIEETQQVRIRTHTAGKGRTTIIWIVVSEGVVYVRSVRGERGRWYQRALADPRVEILVDGEEIEFVAKPVDSDAEISAVSDALRSKYRPGGSLDAMLQSEVLDTTLRLEPRN